MTLPLIYVPIDTGDLNDALAMCGKVVPAGCGIKLGMEFFNARGPQGVAAVRDQYPDTSLFIDLKYHDIPNTVAGAVRAISQLEPDFLNVHASGGPDMMKAAKDALGASKKIKLLAVTILTSMDEKAVSAVGWQLPIADQVKRLALLTKECGLDGVVCSPLEIALVRESCGAGFITMVPGIRPASSDKGDQKRVMTPKEAVQAGATHLVIGRPITGAPDPARAAADILASCR